MNSGLQETRNYLQPLFNDFERHRNIEDASSMKAYMKNHFDFFGIRSPERKRIARQFLTAHGLPQTAQLDNLVRICFEHNERETQYFAIDLITRMIKKLDSDFFTTAIWMVKTKSWWDSVDAIASNIVGPLVKKNKKFLDQIDHFIADEDMWIQRTALLYQLKYKDQTDPDRLFKYCDALKSDKRFFIRKAIGWALREYSKTDSESVIQFVNNYPLSDLSRKEALKWINKES